MTTSTQGDKGYVPFFWTTDDGEDEGIPIAVAIGVGKRSEDEALAWAIRETKSLGYDFPKVTPTGRSFYRLANEIECRCRGIRTYGHGSWVEAKRRPTKHGGGEFYTFDIDTEPTPNSATKDNT